MTATMVFGSASASTAAIAWWRCGSKRSPGCGSISRMLDFSSAERSCFSVSSTPLVSPVLTARLEAVDHRQQALGEALERVFACGSGLGLRALAGVLGVGHGAHHGVALLLDLGLRFGQ